MKDSIEKERLLDMEVEHIMEPSVGSGRRAVLPSALDAAMG